MAKENIVKIKDSVSIGEAPSVRAKPTPQGVVGGVHKEVASSLRKLSSRLFENIDDALFDMAERADNNATQSLYFDSMREVRRKGDDVRKRFFENINEKFLAFSDKSLTEAASSDNGAKDAKLGLVEDSDLEEAIAIDRMVAKAENRYLEQLTALNKRLSILGRGEGVAGSTNPLSPKTIGNCFNQAVQTLDVDINVKLLVYKLFERYVMDDLADTYSEANKLLINAGLLPQLKRTVSSSSTTEAQKNTHQPTQNQNQNSVGPDPGRAQDGGRSVEDANSTLQRISDMLAGARAGAAPQGGPPASIQGGVVSPAGQAAAGSSQANLSELLSALTVIQKQAQAMHLPAQPSASVQDIQAIQSGVEAEKQAAQEHIEQTRRQMKSRVAGADEDTIDLVSMLFNYVLDDDTLPDQMQALLGRLQIPYMKAAFLDRKMFAKPTHPARRLLDQMADSAKGWSAKTDKNLALFNEMKAIIHTLLDDFEENMGLFDKMLERFESFKVSTDKRTQSAESKLVSEAKGKERLYEARRIVSKELVARRADQNIPKVINDILMRPWASYMVLIVLKDGVDSDPWRQALRFVDALIFSGQPATSKRTRDAIKDVLPYIERTLRKGLFAVSFSDSDIKSVMRSLGELYKRTLKGDNNFKGSSPLDKNKDTQLSNNTTEQGETVLPMIEDIRALRDKAQAVSNEQPGEPGGKASKAARAKQLAPTSSSSNSSSSSKASSYSEEAMREVKGISPGIWVNVIDKTSDDPQARMKLSWISPISGRYLFVNSRGLKVCDLSPEQLAHRLDTGEMAILKDGALFERALDAIADKLSSSESEN